MNPLIHYTPRLIENARHNARKGYPEELRDTFRTLNILNPKAVTQEIDAIFDMYVAPSKKFSAEAVRKQVLEACGEP